jgi:S-adenosylmethionine:tRNA ribosyltransferase-isomerase
MEFLFELDEGFSRVHYFCPMKRTELKTDDFRYDLPEDRIAKFPLAKRNQSKLLIYRGGDIKEDVFANLSSALPAGSTLVFNDTRVMSARLIFHKSTGARIEVFCLEPFEQTVEQALSATGTTKWKAMIGNLKRFKEGDQLELQLEDVILRATLQERGEEYHVVEFDWESDIPFSEIIRHAGIVPLPPYLNRENTEEDSETYQTVYAKNEGAVAAPTAGLHFVPEQLNQLQSEGFDLAYLTLYVGAGTFKPVTADRLVDHEMHAERIVVHRSTLENLVNSHGPLISVGTTSLRSLESMYWLADKMNFSDAVLPNVEQDDAYELKGEVNWRDAYQKLLEWMDNHELETIDFHSSLYVMPGYEWKVISGLITNFHQPGSTLLALISAWIGDDWRKVYQYALENDFRFLSYGDSSLLLR